MNTFTGFPAFMRKELMQSLRSGRLLIILGVFTLLGAMNAPLTWATPLLLELVASSSGTTAEQLGGTLLNPSALEAWGQYLGNVGQMGVLAILLVCGNTLSSERRRGTLILPLTKGLGRTGVVLAKFIDSTVLWTCGIVLSAVVSALLTVIIFPGEEVQHLLLALGGLWLFGEFLLALVPLSSLFTQGSFSGLILPGGVLMLLLILSGFASVITFNPLLLATHGLGVMSNAIPATDLVLPLIVTVAGALAALVAAVVIFRRSSV